MESLQELVYRNHRRRAKIEIILEYLRQHRRAMSRELGQLLGLTTAGAIKFLTRIETLGLVSRTPSGWWEIDTWFWNHGGEIKEIRTMSTEPRGIAYEPRLDSAGVFWWADTQKQKAFNQPFGTFCRMKPRKIKPPETINQLMKKRGGIFYLGDLICEKIRLLRGKI